MSQEIKDEFTDAKQKRARVQALVVSIVLLGALGLIFFRVGSREATRQKMIDRYDELSLQADYNALKTVATELGPIIAENPRAPAELLVVDARAGFMMYHLYTGVHSQRARARELVEVAHERDPDSVSVKVTQALWEALDGSPDEALTLLDGGVPADVLPAWQAVARAEAALRTGDMEAAAQALESRNEPLALAWATRVAWARGEVDQTSSYANALVQAVPGNQYGKVMGAIASSASMDDDAAVESLRKLLEGHEPLIALNSARVAVALSRALRRADPKAGASRANKLLENALIEDESSIALQTEMSRVHRFNGKFGAARTASDKALRMRSDDPGLLAELAEAAFFNDAAELIENRVGLVSKGSEDSDGVVRGRAIAELIKGNAMGAVQGLEATRHVGAPGNTEIWLAEAWYRAGDGEKTAEAGARAAELLGKVFGPESKEAAIGRMYEGLGHAKAGKIDEGRAILEAAYTGDKVTPWGAWLYGRFHQVAGDAPDAKDAFLRACHNGQDFALACFELANIYDSLKTDAIARRTQTEAREHYLRTSPKGFRAATVRAALGK